MRKRFVGPAETVDVTSPRQLADYSCSRYLFTGSVNADVGLVDAVEKSAISQLLCDSVDHADEF